MKKISTPAYRLLDKIKTPVVGFVAQRGRKEVKKMEYGITASFTEEELITILYSLKKRFEETEMIEKEATTEEDKRYWNNEKITAINTYQKILCCHKEMPW